MSLILEALRKMEQDRNNRRGAAQNIRPEVLRYRAAPAKPRGTGRYLPLALGAVLLACGIAGGLYLRGNRAETARQETAPAVIAQPTAIVAPTGPVEPAAPVLPAPPVSPGQQAAPANQSGLPTVPAGSTGVAVPELDPRAASTPARIDKMQPQRPVAAVPGKPPRGLAPQVPVPLGSRLSVPVGDGLGQPKRRAAQPRPAHREAAAIVQAVPADIAITGIAWQDERSLRRAVVNGSLVGEGAEVAGARVVEIREDRVRMSRGGQVFDAVFSAGFAR